MCPKSVNPYKSTEARLRNLAGFILHLLACMCLFKTPLVLTTSCSLVPSSFYYFIYLYYYIFILTGNRKVDLVLRLRYTTVPFRSKLLLFSLLKTILKYLLEQDLNTRCQRHQLQLITSSD